MLCYLIYIKKYKNTFYNIVCAKLKISLHRTYKFSHTYKLQHTQFFPGKDWTSTYISALIASMKWANLFLFLFFFFKKDGIWAIYANRFSF